MCVGCKSKSSKKPLSECNHLYNELIQLDIDAVAKYKEVGDPVFLLINKQLRSWISKLNKECPPEGELEIIRNKVK